MEIKQNGSQPSGKGPAEWFTGNVIIDPLFQPTIEVTRMSPVSHLKQVLEQPGMLTHKDKR